jgi:hypothetical protein
MADDDPVGDITSPAPSTAVQEIPDFLIKTVSTTDTIVVEGYMRDVEFFAFPFMGLNWGASGGVNKPLYERLIDVQKKLYKLYLEHCKKNSITPPAAEQAARDRFRDFCGGTNVPSGLQKKKGNHADGSAVDINYNGCPWIPLRSKPDKAGIPTYGGEVHKGLDSELEVWRPFIDVCDRACSIFSVDAGGAPDPAVTSHLADLSDDPNPDNVQASYDRLSRIHWAVRHYFELGFDSNLPSVTLSTPADAMAAEKAGKFTPPPARDLASFTAKLNAMVSQQKIASDGKIFFRESKQVLAKDIQADPAAFDDAIKTAPILLQLKNKQITPDTSFESRPRNFFDISAVRTNPALAQRMLDQIIADRETFRLGIVVGKVEKGPSGIKAAGSREPCFGFMNMKRDFVVTMVERATGALRWGACMFGLGPSGSGDVMHFDLNKTAMVPEAMDKRGTRKLLAEVFSQASAAATQASRDLKTAKTDVKPAVPDGDEKDAADQATRVLEDAVIASAALRDAVGTTDKKGVHNGSRLALESLTPAASTSKTDNQRLHNQQLAIDAAVQKMKEGVKALSDVLKATLSSGAAARTAAREKAKAKPNAETWTTNRNTATTQAAKSSAAIKQVEAACLQAEQALDKETKDADFASQVADVKSKLSAAKTALADANTAITTCSASLAKATPPT